MTPITTSTTLNISTATKLATLLMAPLLIGLSGCATQSTPSTSTAAVSFSDSELFINGHINEVTVEEVRALHQSQPIERVRVNVASGDPLATMQLGYWIHRHQYDLVVEEQCLGACANYLFTAAATKYLEPGSVVAWSDGALSSSWTQQNQRYLVPGVRFVAEQYMDAFLRREIRFFERIGVDQGVTAYGYASASGCDNSEAGFYYSIPELLRFGIANVEPAEGNWQNAFEHYPERYCRVDLSQEIDVLIN